MSKKSAMGPKKWVTPPSQAKQTIRTAQHDPKLTIRMDADLRRELHIYAQQIEKPIREIISELVEDLLHNSQSRRDG